MEIQQFRPSLNCRLWICYKHIQFLRMSVIIGDTEKRIYDNVTYGIHGNREKPIFPKLKSIDVLGVVTESGAIIKALEKPFNNAA